MIDNQPDKHNTNEDQAPSRANTGSKKAQNSAARLLAVQAVYQILSNKNTQSPEDAVKEFLNHRAGGIDIDGDELVTPNCELFKDIVIGTFTHFEQLNEMVNANRAAGKQKHEMAVSLNGQSPEPATERAKEPLLYALFLTGTFELMVHQSIDAPIIINDYLHAARAFYDDAEVKLVNAILDGVAKTTR